MAQLLDIYCSGDAIIDGEIYRGPNKSKIASLDDLFPVGAVYIIYGGTSGSSAPDYLPGEWTVGMTCTLGSWSCVAWRRTK